ncbi:hypothetical protein PV326_001616 [Microctonus aethiopoides]|nr:hypothetical protein PV326_001616 [Microctonus aethiopoides]
MKINTQTGIILLAFIYIPNFLVHANAIDKINPVKNNIIVQENAVKVKRGSPVSNEHSSLQFNEMKLIKSTPEEIIDKLHILEKRSPVDTPEPIEDSASSSDEQNMEGAEAAAAHGQGHRSSPEEFLYTIDDLRALIMDILFPPPSYRNLYDVLGGENDLNRAYPPSYNSIFYPEQTNTWYDKWVKMTKRLEKLQNKPWYKSMAEKLFGKKNNKIRMEMDAVEAGPSGWTPQSGSRSIEGSQDDQNDDVLPTPPPYESIFNSRNNPLNPDSDDDFD